MKLDTIIARSRRFVQPYRVTSGKQFSLRHFDPDDIGSFKKHGKADAEKILAEGVEALSALQERLVRLEHVVGAVGVSGNGRCREG